MIHSMTKVEFGKNNQEVLPEMDPAYPFICVNNEGLRYVDNMVPWHWHEYPEIDYVTKGTLDMKTPEADVSVRKGEMLFLNSNVLHQGHYNGDSEVITLLFDTHILSGTYNGLIEQKYFAPVLHCRELQALCLSPDSPGRVRMAGTLIRIVEIMKEEPAGFEMLARDSLSRLWLMLYEETADIRASKKVHHNQDPERMKQMLEFIYRHYPEQISLNDIAASAGLGTRECIRCFQRNVGNTPVRFLIDYRVHTAAQKLLFTDASISRIAEECGFSSDSYFGRIFRETFGCTAREYRKKK